MILCHLKKETDLPCCNHDVIKKTDTSMKFLYQTPNRFLNSSEAFRQKLKKNTKKILEQVKGCFKFSKFTQLQHYYPILLNFL